MPAVNRPFPVPGESLESLLARAWRANYYPGAARAWQRALLPTGWPEPRLLHDPAHLAPLCAFTGLDRRALWGCTLHRFAPAYLWPEDLGPAATAATETTAAGADALPAWPEADRAPFLEEYGRTKVCPLCWRETGALLLPWALRHITACPIHRVLLVDRCAGCGRAVRPDPLRGVCAACGYALGDLATISIQGHAPSMSMTAVLWEAIGCGALVPPQAPPLPDDHPARAMHPATLLLLCWVATLPRLADRPLRPDADLFGPTSAPGPVAEDALGRWGPSWPWPLDARSWPRRTVRQMHRALVEVWEQIVREPPPYADLVTYRRHTDAIRAIKRRGPVDGPSAWPRSGVASEPSWSWLEDERLPRSLAARMRREGSALHRMRAAANPWRVPWRDAGVALPTDSGLMDSIIPIRSDAPPLLSPREAAMALQAGAYAVRRVVEAHQRAAAAAARRANDGRWGALSVLGYPQEAGNTDVPRLTLAEVANLYGMPAGEVAALVAAGFLAAEAGPLVDGAAAYRFSPLAVWGFAQRMRPAREAPPDVWNAPVLVTLGKALRMLADGPARLPQVCAAVLTGVLQAYGPPWEGSGRGPGRLSGIWIMHEDVAHFRAVALLALRPGRDPLLPSGLVRRSLGCTAAALQRLYAATLLVPALDRSDAREIRWEYDAGEVATFARRYPTVGEAAPLLGTSVAVVHRLIAARRLWPVCGPALDGSLRERLDGTFTITVGDIAAAGDAAPGPGPGGERGTA